MEPEARLVLSLARWIAEDRRTPDIGRILGEDRFDWERFNSLLLGHELFSFAHSFFNAHSQQLPSGESGLLQRSRDANLVWIAELEKGFFEIADIFREKGVELLPLKGASFLVDNMYGDKAWLRPMVDIDILIKKEKLAQAGKATEALGYFKDLHGLKESYWEKENYHIAYSKNNRRKGLPFQVEVHWLLDYPGKIPLLPSLWGRIKKVRARGREVALMSAEDAIFCLALHLRRFGNVLSLKSACDFACLLNKHSDPDWDYILKEARNGQMAASLYFRLAQADILFGIQPPAPVLKGLKLSGAKRRSIASFIEKNTFSISDSKAKSVFLKTHFLVYDDLRKPVSMIVNIPQEQFAKFFQLAPYSRFTWLAYRLRPLYFIYFLFKSILKKIKLFPEARLTKHA